VNLVLDDPTAASPEAGSSCSLENYLALPDHSMDARIAEARAKLGATTILLGHHYQRDEVIRFADFHRRQLQALQNRRRNRRQVHCFLRRALHGRERDVLGRDGQQVILPDLNAGCSMADMAEISQVEACWEALERLGLADET
jgi:quinolinate synthase